MEQYEVMGVATHFEVSTVSPEGPTHSGVEQYEVMDVDEESAGADGPGPQRCESIWLSLGQCQSVCPSVFSPCCELGFRMLFTHMLMSDCFHVHLGASFIILLVKVLTYFKYIWLLYLSKYICYLQTIPRRSASPSLPCMKSTHGIPPPPPPCNSH